MRTLADYFGLMAYLWLMHGGIPDDAPVLLEDYRKARKPGRRRPQLRVIKGSAGTARKRVAASEAGEAGEAAA
jgi:hypothetical protein